MREKGLRPTSGLSRLRRQVLKHGGEPLIVLRTSLKFDSTPNMQVAYFTKEPAQPIKSNTALSFVVQAGISNYQTSKVHMTKSKLEDSAEWETDTLVASLKPASRITIPAGPASSISLSETDIFCVTNANLVTYLLSGAAPIDRWACQGNQAWHQGINARPHVLEMFRYYADAELSFWRRFGSVAMTEVDEGEKIELVAV